MLKTVKQALFSTSLQNPKWTALETQSSEYEMRQYEPAKWVSTEVKSMKDWDSAVSVGFMRLFNYIQGSNAKNVKVEMTAPVTTYVEPGAGPACESTFTISFYIPTEHQDDPPQPSESSVFVTERPGTTVYVRSFGGYTNGAKNLEHISKLSEHLKQDGKVFDENVYYSAGYDSPFKPINRHNEVWLIAK
ncbi:heme-binding protein 2 isoform X2 [Pseudophryne corroboree]|uniref:heme-binding protein 2 isoform X2 n=1 Tax=Pseudophryne corroboree TaxID=495146 RepID=UPI0030815DF0